MPPCIARESSVNLKVPGRKLASAAACGHHDGAPGAQWACRPGAAVKLGPSVPAHCGTPRKLAHASPWQHATPTELSAAQAPGFRAAPCLPGSFINHLVPPASWAHPQLRQSALPKSCLGCYSASEWVRFVGRRSESVAGSLATCLIGWAARPGLGPPKQRT
jgi:hypothetical protein